MARYDGNYPKLLITEIPTNFSVQKLRLKLDEIAGHGSVLQINQITRSCARITVADAEVQKKLLSKSIVIPFGGERFTLNIEKVQVDSSDDDDDGDSDQEDNYTFEAPDPKSKAILRYLSKSEEHKKALRAALRKCGSNLISLSAEEIEANLPKHPDHRTGHSPEETCEKCMEQFIERYSSWNEKLENCSSAEEKHIISMLVKYKKNCFGTWYKDSSTILVTGPKDVVEEVKELVKKHLVKKRSRSIPANSLAQAFEYDDVHPAVMRFVSRQKHYNVQMEEKMKEYASVEIEEKDKNMTVRVIPKQRTLSWLHSDFEASCKVELKKFFCLFESWKGKFDPALVAMHTKRNNLFKTASYHDHYVQWHMDTGVVNVTGICGQVHRCKMLMENVMGISPLPSVKTSNEASPPSPLNMQPMLQFLVPSPHYAFLPPQVILPGSSPQTAPVMQDSTRRKSRTSSSGSYSDERTTPSSPREKKILFDAEGIAVPILKFISVNVASRKELGECCSRLASVSIESDHGHIKVHVNFKNKNYSNEDKAKAFSSIDKYFKKFDTKSQTYNKKHLAKVLKDQPELFTSKSGMPIFIKPFPNTGTVKITGRKERVLEKLEEIEHEMQCEVEVETLPIDVFIAQRECEVWKKVEEACKQKSLKISLSSPEAGKIQYKGLSPAISAARDILGEISEKLYEKALNGFSEEQIAFLRQCGKLQHDCPKTNENSLDLVYSHFKTKSIHGSLAFQDSGITLISVSMHEWRKGNEELKFFIKSLEIDLSNDQFTAKIRKSIKSELGNLPVYLIEQRDLKKMQVYHFEGMRTKILEIKSRACDIEVEEKFYPMVKEIAKHIANRNISCKINEMKTAEPMKRNGKCGLLITCEKEDLDTVDMFLEDLKLEIRNSEERIPGYSLYEFLTGDEKHFKIERETDCSIIVQPEVKINSKNLVSIKVGDILDEKCHAIVNSTGKNLSFAGQLSRALTRKYGAQVTQLMMGNAAWVIRDQLCLCRTSGLLPWKYVFNIATPNKEDALKKAILDLLLAANRLGVKSMALPTIGTGNMGLDTFVVASCMKDAFRDFASHGDSNLKDIRVVVYDPSLYPVFKDIAPTTESQTPGIIATVCGNSQEKVNEAMTKLKELCNNSIKRVSKDYPTVCSFSAFVKSRAREICINQKVHLEWKQNGTHEQYCLEGVADNVNRADEEIEKLLEADFPHTWSPMLNHKGFDKVKLKGTSDEYLSVKTQFAESSPQYSNILKIERIQNRTLYEQFKTTKDIKQRENSGRSVTKLLFHGTMPENVDKICASNFDRNYAGENGTAYGRGVYFAVTSRYSVRFTGRGPEKCIFLAEVITGDYVVGKPEYKSPPEKGNTKMLYDSVVDNPNNPQIFVVFRDPSVYPLYLITFQ